ncbi:hypothetical protein AB0J52_11010 [Spirillospora sp. NPDC049652]
MPRGTYLHLEDGTEERFHCAPGPGGWRYVGSPTDGTRLDLVVDSRWRQIRVEIVTPDWWLRGGVTGREITWVRATSSGEAVEHSAAASGFLSESPAFLIAAAHYLTNARSQSPHPATNSLASVSPPPPSPTLSSTASVPDLENARVAAASSANALPITGSPNAVPSGAASLAAEKASLAADAERASFAALGIGRDEAGLPSAAVSFADGLDEAASHSEESGAGEFGDVGGGDATLSALPGGAAVDVRLVRVTGLALATLTEAWRWRLASVARHETDSGSLPVEQYEVTDLATGEVHHVHLAGDVVLDAPGIELIELDTPPNFLTR